MVEMGKFENDEFRLFATSQWRWNNSFVYGNDILDQILFFI